MNARVLLATPLFVLSIATRPLAAQNETGRGFCSTVTSDSVVYVTPVFDTKLKAGSPYRSRLMGLEYNQYIKGRFNYQHSDPHSSTCGSDATIMQAETGRQTLERQVTDAKGRVVPVDWVYQPDSAEVAFSFAAQRVEGGEPVYKLGANDKGFCVTNSYSTPMYISAVFDLPTPGLGDAPRGWTRFLAAKYGYGTQGVDVTKQNPTHCGDGGWGDPARMVRARIAGATAAGRKIVETGWKPGMAEPANATPAPPAPPSPELREAATKDGAEALRFCQSDRVLSGGLDCYLVQRTVYNYRMANGPGLTVAELLANDKLDCSNCINPMNADMWATSRAQSNGFSLPKAKCVGPKFVAALKAKPYVNRVKELFDAAMKACPK